MESVRKITAGLEKVWVFLLYIAVFMLIALLLICAATVSLRKVISGGFNWSDEAMRFLMVYSTFLTLPYLVSKRKNITIDLTDVFFSKMPAGKKLFSLISEILTFVCCVALLPASVTFIQQNMKGLSTAMHLPLWLIYLCMPLGMGLGAVASLNNMAEILVLKEGKEA